jgi:hypothetical protein
MDYSTPNITAHSESLGIRTGTFIILLKNVSIPYILEQPPTMNTPFALISLSLSASTPLYIELTTSAILSVFSASTS